MFRYYIVVLLLILGADSDFAYARRASNTCPGHSIKIAEETLISANRDGIEYCRLLNQALKGKPGAIFLFSLLSFDASAHIGHGVTLLHVVKIVGEKTYLEIFRSKPDNLYPLILDSLEAGAAYSHEHPGKATVDEIFPVLSLFLKKKNNI